MCVSRQILFCSFATKVFERLVSMKHPRKAALGRQQGQALTEVVLALLLVLIPLFVFGWALYAHSQTRTTALSAARYAAWERTVWHSGESDSAAYKGKGVRDNKTIENLMIERVFVQSDAPIVSHMDAQNTKNDKLPSFYDLHNGDGLLELEKTEGKINEGSRPTLEYGPGRTTSQIKEKESYKAAAEHIEKLGGAIAELETQGIHVADVSVKLNAVRNVKLLEDLNLTYRQKAAVLTDGWNLGGSEHEKTLVGSMVPPPSFVDEFKGRFGINEIHNALNWEPFDYFDFGHVEPDIVPSSDTIIR
jgi:hypothetical protein